MLMIFLMIFEFNFCGHQYCAWNCGSGCFDNCGFRILLGHEWNDM